jgi:formylmethanofuran dehydrogenase subunit B
VPTIVIGNPAMRFARAPAAFIPVSTPGLHHAGHFFRSDGVMAVRLRKLTDSLLPSTATALSAIERAL